MKNTAMQYTDVLSLTETKLDDTLGSSQPNKCSFSSTIKFQEKKKEKKMSTPRAKNIWSF